MMLSLDRAGAGHLATRIQRRVRAARARAWYRLGITSDPGPVRINTAFRHPVADASQALTVARYRALFRERVDREIGEARRLAAHQFTLLGHRMHHGESIAWSRDPVSGRDWSRGFSPDIVYRSPARLGDIKLPWELNKHQYFFTLGQAAWLSGDVRFAAEIVRQIEHWIADNPCERGINWISALETGTRAVSWIMAYPFYAGCGNEQFRRQLARSLAEHMFFVERHLSIGPFANTHLAGEAAALVAGGLFLACPHSARWLDIGLRTLDQEIDRQVTADGIHAERSVAYHRFFLDQLYLAAALLRGNGRSLASATYTRMEQMTDTLASFLFPDGAAADFGDADDARGIWVRTDCPSDYRGLLALGAGLFERAELKTAAGRVSEEVFWLLGAEGLATFDRLPAGSAPHSVDYPDAGYYVMRGGTGSRQSVLAFDCGPLGFGAAGHGHADALSFQLHAAGSRFLVDAGTFSYNLDYAWRDAFRSTAAHNTLVVDGQDQSTPRDRMSWVHKAQSRAHRWVTTPWFDLADGEHDGYCRLADPVRHRRTIAFVKPDVWFVWDELSGETQHRVDALLHPAPGCRVEARAGGQACVISPAGQCLDVWMFAETNGETKRPPEFDIVDGDDHNRAAWFSSGYGTRIPSRVLRVVHAFSARTSLVTCLSVAELPKPAVRHRPGMMTCRLERDGRTVDTFIYRTGEHEVVDTSDVTFDGTLLFFRKAVDGASVAWAGGCRHLSLQGLEIRAAKPIESLVLQHDRCNITFSGKPSEDLQVRLPEGVRLTVNGRSCAASASGACLSMVTA
jgi:hypothetical protein